MRKVNVEQIPVTGKPVHIVKLKHAELSIQKNVARRSRCSATFGAKPRSRDIATPAP